MINKERLDSFLKELAELTNKYGLVIGGCGCCGSPYINDIDYGGVAYDLLFEEDGKYMVLDIDKKWASKEVE